jgi:hypothetical protein
VKITLPVALLSILALGLLTGKSAYAQAKPATQHFMPDVHIVQCFITQPKMMSKKASGTQIVYKNMGTQTYSSVTFLVGYRNSENNFTRKVVDQGSFGPGVQIDHHFPLYNDVTYGGKATTLCGAIAAAH